VRRAAISVGLVLAVGGLAGCGSTATSPSAEPLPASPVVAVLPVGSIAFARTIFDPTTNQPTAGDIWSVETDGMDLVQLTDLPELELYPAWSPDGARFAFVRTADTTTGDIWLIDADPTAADRHLTQLTDGPGLEFAPAWSPDGRWIAYVDDWQAAPSIWIRAADGTGEPRRIVDGNWPSWTPDGARLLVTVGSDFKTTKLAYVPIEGGEPETLPIQVPNASEGAVSPLGEIAFVSSANGYAEDDPSTWNEDVYTIGSDGRRGPIQVSFTPVNDHWPPSWSPGGDWLAYTNDGGTDGSRIAIVLPTGEPTYLTEGAYDAFPAWRPVSVPPT
jgi:TolB protein